MLAEKALVALTDLKRLESNCELPVHDTMRDLESDRSRRVTLLNEAPLSTPPRRRCRNCIHQRG
jgi:hypothetical protein